jgi:hypothetical protein
VSLKCMALRGILDHRTTSDWSVSPVTYKPCIASAFRIHGNRCNSSTSGKCIKGGGYF